MNFLAHAFLSNQTPEGFAGTIGGDSVKGRMVLETLSQPYRWAVLEHRHVDSISASLKTTRAVSSLLSEKEKRWSGVLTDIYFDHLLAQNFGRYMEDSVDQYCSLITSTLQNSQSEIPELLLRKLEPILKYQLISACQSIEGVEEVLYRISKRFKRIPDLSLQKHVTILHENHHLLNECFLEDLEFVQLDLSEWRKTLLEH